MRFRDGALTRRVGGTVYQVQRYFVGGREMLYLVTFCLPRFLDQTFEEKLVTVFHELYHISPNFDGDLRRHEGRYAVHSRSKRAYDERMAALGTRLPRRPPGPRPVGVPAAAGGPAVARPRRRRRRLGAAAEDGAGRSVVTATCKSGRELETEQCLPCRARRPTVLQVRYVSPSRFGTFSRRCSISWCVSPR